MPEALSHGGYVNSARKQVVDTACAMLDGQLSFLIGARRLASLRHEVDGAYHAWHEERCP